MGHWRLLQLDLLELEVCLFVVAAAVAPSSLVLQVVKEPDSEEPLELPDFQEFRSNWTKVTQR